MSSKWSDKSFNFDFLNHDEEKTIDYKTFRLKPIKILIADDDKEVHVVTKMMLKNFNFEGRKLEFIDTYSGEETKVIFRQQDDIAVVFLDVVMEDTHSGLEVVEYIRQELKNHMTRIILRTGQPGEAPEERVIRDFDINDYRLKTEMTMQRQITTLYSALRNYRDLNKLDRNRKGLEKIIKASANLFEHNTIEDFFSGILEQLTTFYSSETELVYIRGKTEHTKQSGFVTLEEQEQPLIVAATGKYQTYVGKDIREIDTLKKLYDWMDQNKIEKNEIEYVNNGYIIKKSGQNQLKNYIFIEGNRELYDLELIHLFMTNYSIALDNFVLNSMISDTQKEIIITLGEVAEKHFEDNSDHVRRVSNMMFNFAKVSQLPYSESEMLRVASTMHDVGKIAIPDKILKKPGKLSEKEFEAIKKHPVFGYEILSKSHLGILKLAAEIALNHHEKFNGTGYPNGLKGEAIPKSARMMAIIDVFDAMTHERCYKKAIPVDETLAYIEDLKGTHFDPELTEIFLRHYSDIARGTSF